MDKKEESFVIAFAIALLFVFIVALVCYLGFGAVLVGIICIVSGFMVLITCGLIFMHIRKSLKKKQGFDM